jgi:uncharacterized coiled-coil DUF342 family protein
MNLVEASRRIERLEEEIDKLKEQVLEYQKQFQEHKHIVEAQETEYPES